MPILSARWNKNVPMLMFNFYSHLSLLQNLEVPFPFFIITAVL